MYNDDDLKALENQVAKARAVWGRIGKILKIRSDSNIRIMSIFYKVIIQTVLLYGSEKWVLNEYGRNKLKSFHNKCAQFMTGRYITKIDDEWVYPETKKTLELAHLLPVEDYIMKRINTILPYAFGTEIYKECIAKSGYIKGDNSWTWWTDNKQDTEQNETAYDNYDPNEIELEWGTEDGNELNEAEITI